MLQPPTRFPLSTAEQPCVLPHCTPLVSPVHWWGCPTYACSSSFQFCTFYGRHSPTCACRTSPLSLQFLLTRQPYLQMSYIMLCWLLILQTREHMHMQHGGHAKSTLVITGCRDPMPVASLFFLEYLQGEWPAGQPEHMGGLTQFKCSDSQHAPQLLWS